MNHRLIILVSLALLYWDGVSRADMLSPFKTLISACRGSVSRVVEDPTVSSFSAASKDLILNREPFSLLTWKPLSKTDGEIYMDKLIGNLPSHYVIFFTRKDGWDYSDRKNFLFDSVTTRDLFRSGFDFAQKYNSQNPGNEIEFSQFEVRWAQTDNQNHRINQNHVHETGTLVLNLAYGEPGGTILEYEQIRAFGGSSELQAPSGTPILFKGEVPHRSPPASLNKRLLLSWTFSPKTRAAELRRANSPF